MAEEKEFIEFIKLVSPGTILRSLIDDLVRAGLGAIIVVSPKEDNILSYIEGGFKINSKLTPEKLFELCKMDGAIVVSSDLKKILFSNVQLNPDPSIFTNETGMRHKAAERIAKQLKTLVITVSERRKKTTLYYCNSKYHLKRIDELLGSVTSSLHVIEKQKELFLDSLSNLNILEVSSLVSASDVCKVIQRSEMILKISDSVRRNLIELGKEGHVIQMRFKELIKGVDKIQRGILRDYTKLSLKKSKNLISNFSYAGLTDLEAISRLLLEKDLDESVSPRGFRFLSHLGLNEKEISLIVKMAGNLDGILRMGSEGLEGIFKERAVNIVERINNLKEQIISGKVVC